MGLTPGAKKFGGLLLVCAVAVGGYLQYDKYSKAHPVVPVVTTPAAEVAAPVVAPAVQAPAETVAPAVEKVEAPAPVKKHVAKSHAKTKTPTTHHSSAPHSGGSPSVHHEDKDAAALKELAGEKM